MRFVRLAAALTTLVTALPACEPGAEGPVALPAPAFADHNQDGVVDFNDLTLWRASFPGSGDLQIYAGSTTGGDDDDDGLIFEFGNGSIIGRTSPSSGTPDDDDVEFGEIARVEPDAAPRARGRDGRGVWEPRHRLTPGRGRGTRGRAPRRS